jgi:oligosaccharyltransferase complex subunit beta
VRGNKLLLVIILHVPPESFASDTDSDSGAEALFDDAERAGEGFWAGSNLGVATVSRRAIVARAAVGPVASSSFSDTYVN